MVATVNLSACLFVSLSGKLSTHQRMMMVNDDEWFLKVLRRFHSNKKTLENI